MGARRRPLRLVRTRDGGVLVRRGERYEIDYPTFPLRPPFPITPEHAARIVALAKRFEQPRV